jgi:hypothetical protein
MFLTSTFLFINILNMIFLLFSLLHCGYSILLRTKNLTNTSIQLELQINEPFVYEFDETLGENLTALLIPISRYNLDSPVNFCQLYQLDYQYNLKPVMPSNYGRSLGSISKSRQ